MEVGVRKDSVVSIDVFLVFSQVPSFQTVPINGIKYRPHQDSKLLQHPLKLRGERVSTQVVVHVANQVHETPLLPAIKRIVAGEEIRDQHALESSGGACVDCAQKT
jgi:hypothetical protein